MVLWLATAFLVNCGCHSLRLPGQSNYSHFIGRTNFTDFSRSTDGQGEITLLSPVMDAGVDWNQLVVSWNAAAPPGTYLKVAARALGHGVPTRFYSLGWWSPDNLAFPRTSQGAQHDADGEVNVDTLALSRLADAVQVRLTLGGMHHDAPALKFLGLSFCNTNVLPPVLPPNRAAWGKLISTPERSQQSYAGGGGWCSPTSVSMALARWGMVAQREDWNLDAPAVAAGVYDHGFYHPTGNWSFNTAFAGSLSGMRAYVTRLNDISELEDWIAAGIPVMISARWDLLQDGRPPDLNGHLTICRGFTKTGDLVINDPWTDVKVESVRHIYQRENVRRAWATSHNKVYLIYPENVTPPADRFGHW